MRLRQIKSNPRLAIIVDILVSRGSVCGTVANGGRVGSSLWSRKATKSQSSIISVVLCLEPECVVVRDLGPKTKSWSLLNISQNDDFVLWVLWAFIHSSNFALIRKYCGLVHHDTKSQSTDLTGKQPKAQTILRHRLFRVTSHDRPCVTLPKLRLRRTTAHHFEPHHHHVGRNATTSLQRGIHSLPNSPPPPPGPTDKTPS